MRVIVLPVDHTSARTRPVDLFAFALWMALAGGAVEVSILFLRKQADPLLRFGEDVVWMAPLALASITAVGAGLARLLSHPFGTRLTRPLTLFAASALVFLDLLILVPWLEHFAAALLAAGLAVQSTRLVSRYPDATRRLVRRTAPWLLGWFIVTGGAMWASLRPALSPLTPASSDTSRQPNVLFITLDTVRAANVSLYGYSRQTTPRLDRFAERGVVFERAFSTAPWTLPSHASMFTGRWPHELSTDYTSALDGKYPTLAEFLGSQGYLTAGFVANLGYCSTGTGLARGFQSYDDYQRSLGTVASSSTLVRTIANNFRLRRLIRNDQHLERSTADDLNRRALAWISGHAGRPFFLFLNYFDAHEPYLPPPPFDRQFGPGRRQGRHSPLNHWLWNRAVNHGNMGQAERQEELDAYDGAIAYLDRHIGLLLDDLDRRRLLDNTVVFITSDHGEEFGEHGVYDHGYSLYRAGLQVPLVVVAPGRVPPGRRVAAPISLRDLAATVVDLAGHPQGTPFPGTSLARHWQAATSAGNDGSPVFSEVSRSPGQPEWFPSSKGAMKSIVSQDLRYIRNGDGSEELYDLTRDWWERGNLASVPDRAAALAELRSTVERLGLVATQPVAK